jgi:hypothetical protein
MLGALGLALAFDVGKGCLFLLNPSAIVGIPLSLVAWPVFCFGGLMAGVNLGSRIDRLFPRQDLPPLGAARNRRWLVRCLGLLQGGLSLALIVVLASLFPSTSIARSLTGLVAVRPALMLVGAGVAWLLLLKGWLELLTGVRFQEWPSFWRSLSPGRKLVWVVGFYGSGVPLMLLPALMLMRLVTS